MNKLRLVSFLVGRSYVSIKRQFTVSSEQACVTCEPLSLQLLPASPPGPPDPASEGTESASQ